LWWNGRVCTRRNLKIIGIEPGRRFRLRLSSPWSEEIMLKDIVEARILEGYRVHLRFEDGVEGDVDLGRLIRFEGVFAPLRDPKEFVRLTVNLEIGTICWPNGAD